MDPSLAGVRFSTDAGVEGGHVFLALDHWHWIHDERGAETGHKVTKSRHELLRWLVGARAWSLASDYELAHREPGRDFRRLMFRKEVEYLARGDSDWARARQEEIDALLVKHPFRDDGEK